MVIKRSWFYGIYILGLTILNFAVSLLHLLFSQPWVREDFVIARFIVGIGIASVLFVLYSGLAHLVAFSKLSMSTNITTGIHDIDEVEDILKKGDRSFEKAFNQITFWYLVFYGILLFEIAYLIYISGKLPVFPAYVDIGFTIFQIALLSFYRLRMIDLEMDYIAVVPGKIYMVDQTGIHTVSQTLRSVQNIKSVQSRFPNFIASLFNYGTIEVEAETLFHLSYVRHPLQTVNQMNELLLSSKEEQKMSLQEKILTELGIPEADESEKTEKLGNYLLENEERMHDLYEKWSPQEKQEIRKLYLKYIPSHSVFRKDEAQSDPDKQPAKSW